MIVYRLSKKQYANDLSGIGAEKFGGRWNNKGTRIVYTSDSRALACLEVAVHVALNTMPKNYCLTQIELPDDTITFFNEKKLLGTNWRGHPPLELTQKIGDGFIRENKHLALRVPSAIVVGEYNYLINPLHTDFNKVTIVQTELFGFDQRLFNPNQG